MENNILVSKADIDNINEVVLLFDQYRMFYGQESNIENCYCFIKERFKLKDSEIFIATDKESKEVIGFVQLYPTYSSVGMKRVWILNDLFVTQNSRRKGVAKELLGAVKIFAKESNAARISLCTAISNVNAQHLYESNNYIKDEVFYHYSLSL